MDSPPHDIRVFFIAPGARSARAIEGVDTDARCIRIVDERDGEECAVQHLKCNLSELNSLEELIAEPIWDCGVVLAAYIWYNRKKYKDKVVLEIGAGFALPSRVLLSISGCQPIASDRKEVLQSQKRKTNASSVPVPCQEMVLDWGYFPKGFSERMGELDIDMIIGSDLVYDLSGSQLDVAHSLHNMFSTVVKTFELCGKPVHFDMTFEERYSTTSAQIEAVSAMWGLDCHQLALPKISFEDKIINNVRLVHFQTP